LPTAKEKATTNWNNGNGPKFENKGDINIFVGFSDLKGADVEWAVKYIASLSGKNVFQGFEDGTFRPREKVTRIQAIVAAVRNMGLEAQAQQEMNAQLNFKDADKIPDWAVGYVSVALKNDLFIETESSVQPDKPADRLWATMLLVKSTRQYDAEVKANMNATLPFKDAQQIPAGAVGYVKVALDHNLIDGFDDNTFRPNEPVTRAQLAALLDRVSDQLPGEENNVVKGKVTATANNGYTLTISTTSGVKTVALDQSVMVFRNDGHSEQQVAPSGIQVGDTVRIRLVNNVGRVVEAVGTTQNNAFTYSGTVYSFEKNTDGKLTKMNLALNGDTINIRPLDVSANVVFENPNSSVIFANGLKVELSGTGTTVTKIKYIWN
jgi:hypothetical protein